MQQASLLHNVVKYMLLWRVNEDGQEGYCTSSKQWASVGDSCVLGCKLPQ